MPHKRASASPAVDPEGPIDPDPVARAPGRADPVAPAGCPDDDLRAGHLPADVPAEGAGTALSSDTLPLALAFERAMAAAEPFEPAPHLAVAVSGGADSMALCLLASDWARARGGCVTALTVDHGLRPESREEAASVAGSMAELGIRHRVLTWRGPKPVAGIQEQARAARRELLVDWCAAAGVLHLLLGHHLGDQRETVLLRLLRGSGTYGLAGIASVVDGPRVRILRPLLGCEPGRLRDFLLGRGRAWIEDPGNRDPRFARTGVRRALAADAAGAGIPSFGLGEALLATSAAAGEARLRRDEAVADLLAVGCTLHDAGWADWVRAELRAAPQALAFAALAAVVAVVGGGARPPSESRVRRACGPLLASEDAGTTLGRCRLLARGEIVSVFRERRGLPAERPLHAGRPQWWDGRFRLTLAAAADGRSRGFRVRPPSEGDLRRARRRDGLASRRSIPHLAMVGMPVLTDRFGGYMALLPPCTSEDRKEMQRMGVEAVFCPRVSATGAGYFLVPDNSRIIC